jgi:thiamine-phosphate pyrophosphorylase
VARLGAARVSEPAGRGPLLVQITDQTQIAEELVLARLEGLVAPSARRAARHVVMLRDPQLPSQRLLALARRLRDRTRAAGALLWVNDRLDVAALVGADGVHLGRRSVAIEEARRFLGSPCSVSIACHGVEEVLSARDRGADAATPGFALLALGGVDASNVGPCLEAGADGAAAIRADLSLVALPHRG